MSVYSKTISDKELVNLVQPSWKRVLIFACAGCMNDSLAFDLGQPISEEKNQLSFPSLEIECRRIIDLLKTCGIVAERKILSASTNSRCIINLDEPPYPLLDNGKYDAVLALCCHAGYIGIKRFVGQTPAYAITYPIGVLNYLYSSNQGTKTIVSGNVVYF